MVIAASPAVRFWISSPSPASCCCFLGLRAQPATGELLVCITVPPDQLVSFSATALRCFGERAVLVLQYGIVARRARHAGVIFIHHLPVWLVWDVVRIEPFQGMELIAERIACQLLRELFGSQPRFALCRGPKCRCESRGRRVGPLTRFWCFAGKSSRGVDGSLLEAVACSSCFTLEALPAGPSAEHATVPPRLSWSNEQRDPNGPDQVSLYIDLKLTPCKQRATGSSAPLWQRPSRRR